MKIYRTKFIHDSGPEKFFITKSSARNYIEKKIYESNNRTIEKKGALIKSYVLGGYWYDDSYYPNVYKKHWGFMSSIFPKIDDDKFVVWQTEDRDVRYAKIEEIECEQ